MALWRGPLEGPIGGPLWRAPFEGFIGGLYWRAPLERPIAGPLWRALLEGPLAVLHWKNLAVLELHNYEELKCRVVPFEGPRTCIEHATQKPPNGIRFLSQISKGYTIFAESMSLHPEKGSLEGPTVDIRGSPSAWVHRV